MRLYIHLNDLFVDFPATHTHVFGTETLTPGVYSISSAGSLAAGTLTLDGQEDSNSFFVIKFSGAFTTGAATINLINGAQSCNVFFIADGAITIGANANIKGTLFSKVGAVGLGADVVLEGRMFTMAGAITIGTGASAVPPSCTSTIPVFCESGCTPAPAVDVLGVLSDFALFTSLGDVGNTSISGINGNIGTNLGSINGYTTGIHIGTEENANTLTAQAEIDLYNAYAALMALPAVGGTHTAAFGDGERLSSGVYDMAAGSLTGTITLDGRGNPDAIFVMRFAGAFNVTAGAKIILINGAKRCNIFWIGGAAVATGAVNIGTNAIVKGTFISHGGACNSGVNVFLAGRQFSTTGAVNTNTGILYNNPECVISKSLLDTDSNGIPDATDTDDDGDGVNDSDEALIETNPLLIDTDGDGIDDGAEDFDNDGIDNATESDATMATTTDIVPADGNPDITFNSVLSVEVFNIKNIYIRPNPFNDKISIHLPMTFDNDSFEIKLLDLNGRVILNYKSQIVNGLINIENLNNLKQGPYIIKIVNNRDGKNSILKLIKY